MTIDILTGDVLLEILNFYLAKAYPFKPDNRWQKLVHVCRKWRNVIFESPRRLNLQLVCSHRTPVREMLDIWPLLPIMVHSMHPIGHSTYPTLGPDNVVAALEHNDRIRQITLTLSNSLSKSIFEATQEPFPALAALILFGVRAEAAPVIPDLFLGGSAPRLRFLLLEHILFPGLSKFLISTTDLVNLHLGCILHSGYISPEAMANCLSVLTRLYALSLEFESPRSRPNRERRPLSQLTRSVLPRLTEFHFAGVGEYLEDLVARIDSPRLVRLGINLFHQLIFDTPQLMQFITRTPELKVYDQAHVYFSNSDVRVIFPQTPSDWDNGLKLEISCKQPEWQLSAMAQIFSSSFPQSLIHKVERLYIRERSYSGFLWQDDIENSQWLELLHPFTAVKSLHLCKEFAPRFTPSLQELIGERTTEVLPALQSLSLEELHPSGPFEDPIGKFVAARQLFNLPIAVSY